MTHRQITTRGPFVFLLLSALACGRVKDTSDSNVEDETLPTEDETPPNGSSGGNAGTPEQNAEDADDSDSDEVLVVASAEDLDDDIPVGGAFIHPRGLGSWFVTDFNNDTTDAPLVVLDPPREESTQAYRGGEENGSGAISFWAQFNHPLGTAVDLSDYNGVAFWARLLPDGGAVDVDTNNGGQGLTWDKPAGYLLELEPSWQYYSLTFEELGVVDRSLSSLDFIVGESGKPYTFELDDFALICDGRCP